MRKRNVLKPLWLRTQDEDLHPAAAELPGVGLHRILRFAVCDDQQHFGEIFAGAGRFAERVFQHEVEGIAWSGETRRRRDEKTSAISEFYYVKV